MGRRIEVVRFGLVFRVNSIFCFVVGVGIFLSRSVECGRSSGFSLILGGSNFEVVWDTVFGYIRYLLLFLFRYVFVLIISFGNFFFRFGDCYVFFIVGL